MKLFLISYLVLELMLGSTPLKKKVPGEVCSMQNNDGIELIISNIKNNKGLIRIGLFNSEAGYPDNPAVSFSLAKDTICEGVLRLFIPVQQSDSLGLSILDDENENGKMDYIFQIKPKEGFGFSNNPVMESRKPPLFGQILFKFPGGRLSINVTMVYI